MSVCAHVSKVSKDYSPYGYSIMETASATIHTESAGTYDKSALLLVNDDADIYIESITINSLTAIVANDTDFLTVSLNSFDAAGSGPSAVAHFTQFTTKTTGSGGGGALATGTQYSQTVLSPVMALGRSLVFKVKKSTSDPSIDDKEIAISVRYRRKA